MENKNSYAGKLNIPKGVTIRREGGCQFNSQQINDLHVRCGSTLNLNQKQRKECLGCTNFYYEHTKPEIKGAYQSVFARTETY